MSDTTPRPDQTPTEPPAPEEVSVHDTPPPPPPPAAPSAPEEFSVQDTPPPPPPPPPAAETMAPEAPAAYPPPPPPGQQVEYPQPAYAPSQQPMTPTDERTAGMAAHGVALAATVLSGGLLGFVAALVMYLVFRDRGPFVRHHTANALNVQIIAGIVMLVSIPLMFVLIGFVTFAAAWLFAVVVHIIGAVKANNGEWWNPPMTPSFVK